MVNDIQVRDLYVYFPVEQGLVKAVDGINIDFAWSKFTAIIGESGCGKSVLGQALLNILPEYVQQQGGIIYQRHDILHDKLPNKFYGLEFGIVPQNPGDSLSSTRKIVKQMQDVLDVAGIADSDDAVKIKWLKFFGLADTKRILQSYPYELSGGMQQRVLCAMSCMCHPKWILADEPTKGLDERVCGVVYDNLQKIKVAANCGMVIITHDLKLAQQVCDMVAVMYSGQILEAGEHIFTKPLHPYTQAFMKSLPQNGFQPMAGTAPSPADNLAGCKFAPRCPYASEHCRKEIPPVYKTGDTMVRCFLYAES